MTLRPCIQAMLATRLRLANLAIGLALAMLLAPPAHADRIRDLGAFQGVRTNQLTGYGIVVGLHGR